MDTVARAFELAKTGKYRSLEDLRRKLKQEKYEAVDQHISGKSLGDQLRAMCGVRHDRDILLLSWTVEPHSIGLIDRAKEVLEIRVIWRTIDVP